MLIETLRKQQTMLEQHHEALERQAKGQSRLEDMLGSLQEAFKIVPQPPLSVDTQLKALVTPEPQTKDVRLPPVETFTGKSKNFETFWRAITIHFKLQPLSFATDEAIIAYLFLRLDGNSK